MVRGWWSARTSWGILISGLASLDDDVVAARYFPRCHVLSLSSGNLKVTTDC